MVIHFNTNLITKALLAKFHFCTIKSFLMVQVEYFLVFREHNQICTYKNNQQRNWSLLPLKRISRNVIITLISLNYILAWWVYHFHQLIFPAQLHLKQQSHHHIELNKQTCLIVQNNNKSPPFFLSLSPTLKLDLTHSKVTQNTYLAEKRAISYKDHNL